MSNPPDPVDDEGFTWRGKHRGPGRPRGSKNTYKVVADLPSAVEAQPDDLRVPDLSDMIANQLRIIKAAQTDLARGGSLKDVVELSRALDAAVGAVARAAKSQDDILAKMSQAQQLESAVRRIEEQDAATVALVVRRLRARLQAQVEATGPRTAVDAIQEL